jgi:hypothetical protein
MRYVAAISSALVLAACSASSEGSDAASGSDALSAEATAASGTVTVVARNSGKCVDVPSNATTDDLQLQQYACNGTTAQSFVETKNTSGTVTFKNVHSGLCLDVRGDSAANGTVVQQATCDGNESQQFTLAAVSGSSSLVNVKTAHGKCLDVSGQSTASGAKLQEWACTGNANQEFTVSGGTPSAPPTDPPPANAKYLSKLGAKCNGSDDSAAFIAAVAGARNGAYTLVVDCAATLDIGLNVDRTVFIDSGTTIQFTSAGKLVINNLFEPAFAIVNSSDIKLVDWNVEWNGSLPVSLATGSYGRGGKTYSVNGNGSGVFNDDILSGWLTANRGVEFADGPTHGIWSNWQGSVNTGAIFYLVGSASNVSFTGLNLHSADTSDPSKYIPFGFTFGKNFKSNQRVTVDTPKDTDTSASKYFDCPRNISFDGVTLDGIIMGFQGNTIGSSFSNVKIEHVSDLQDASGNNVGGEGRNFPPPHAFYLNYAYAGDPALFNSGLSLRNINEVGPRMGKVRPGGGGYADSLKLGCYNCTVDGYTTNRKDGFMDVLNSENLTVSNVVATFDSSFVDVYEDWPAWRWPGGGSPSVFKNITFSHVSLTDEAATSVAAPLSNNPGAGNANLVFDDVNITVQSWTKGNIVPTWSGIAAGSEVTFTLKAQKETQVLK